MNLPSTYLNKSVPLGYWLWKVSIILIYTKPALGTFKHKLSKKSLGSEASVSPVLE